MKHEHDKWEDEKTKLTTCPTAKQLANQHQNPQEVVANEELVFTYDVKFEVQIVFIS